MNSVFIELIRVAVDSLRRYRRIRFAVLVLAPLVFLALIFVMLVSDELGPSVSATVHDLVPPVLFVVALLFMLTLLSFTSIRLGDDGTGLSQELELLRRKREEIQRRLSEPSHGGDKERADIFDTIQLSLNQITEYYTINKSQAVNSFRFSIFAIVAGLLTLIGGVWLFYFSEPRDVGLTAISGIASVLAEFIGAAYFYLYNRSLSQLNFFYAKLVKMQDTMLAIQLSESLSEPRCTEIKERLIIALLQRSSEAQAADVIIPMAAARPQDAKTGTVMSTG